MTDTLLTIQDVSGLGRRKDEFLRLSSPKYIIPTNLEIFMPYTALPRGVGIEPQVVLRNIVCVVLRMYERYRNNSRTVV